MTTEATNGIEPIIVGIKRDTREILDIFASGGTSSSRPGDYSVSPGPQTDIVITVKLDDTTGRNFIETSRQGSGGGRVQIASPAPVAPTAPVVASHAPVAVDAPVITSPTPVVTTRAPQARDANGRFISATQQLTGAISTLGESLSTTAVSSQSAGQRAHAQVTSGGEAASGTDARPQTFMSRMKDAGAAATRNGDLAETVGLATLGPITGVISEMVGLGSQIKETFTGIVDKFRGIRGNRGTGDRSVDAQIRATSEVTTAVHASDTAAEQRNQQLIAAISTLGEVQTAGPSQSAGQQAHYEATHGGASSASVAGSAGAGGGGTGGHGSQSSGGGLFSRIGDNITGVIAGAITGAITSGAIAIVPVIVGALPTIMAAVFATGVASVIGIRAYKAYNDTEGQREYYGLPPGEEPSTLQKSSYAADKAGGVDTLGFDTDEKEQAAIDRWRPNAEQAAAMAAWRPNNPDKTATDAPQTATATDGSSQQGPPKKAEMTGVLATAFKAQQEIIRTALEMATAAATSARLPVHTMRFTKVGKVGRVTESTSTQRTSPVQTTATPVMTSSPEAATAQTTATPVMTSSPEAATAQTATPVAASGKKRIGGGKKGDYEYTGLGSLSEHYESRGDVGAVAPDVKGMAYGKFQMHSGGTVGDFIKQSPWAKDFEGMKPGSKEYNEQWPKTAAKDPQAFGQAQFDFIKKTHYAPTERKAKKMGIDTTDPMLQEVLFSTGTQHGPKGGPQLLDQAFPKGVDPKTLTSEQIRERIYAERGRKNADGTLAHFPSLKGGIEAHNKQGNRFINENKDAAKIGALSSSAVASKIGQPVDEAMAPAAPTTPAAPVQTVTTSPVSAPAPETAAPVQPVTTIPVSAPSPETAAPVQPVATGTQQAKGKGEPSIFAQAMKGVDPRTLTSEQRKEMYFAELNRKDANGNLVHPPKGKGKDAQIGQPVDEATSQPQTVTSQPAATQQPAAIASSQQTQPPAPAPIVQPKPEPQPVVIANSGGSSGGSSGTGGQQGGFQKAQTDRRQTQPQQQSQTQKQPSIIPFEFDDIMLTLMTHDLM